MSHGDRGGAYGIGRDLDREIAAALADEDQKGALRKATAVVNRKRGTALDGLDDPAGARARAREVKERSLAELPALLDRLEAAVEERGGRVHRAADARAACRVVRDLARERGVSNVVKSKSMTTEEIELNDALEADGVVVRETDLGEYIVQLAGDRPSHIIAPIIHKTVEDVREAFRQGLDLDEVPETPAELTQLARRLLRRQFVEADLGITGGNFLLAVPRASAPACYRPPPDLVPVVHLGPGMGGVPADRGPGARVPPGAARQRP